MRQGPPVCIHNKPIEGLCRDCGCNASSPCSCPNLQPLAKEPDYGPLVEWVREKAKHVDFCQSYWIPREGEAEHPCSCGLTEALKAAGL